MNFIQFLICYFIIVLLGSLAVTGWFFITRGTKEIQPDGTIKKKGKIFMGWYFFWTKTKESKKRIYYKGAALYTLVTEINDMSPVAFLLLNTGNDSVSIRPSISTSELTKMLKVIGAVEIDEQSQDEDFRVTEARFFKEEPIYVFPWWLRDPLAQCSTCFSSIYGSLFYWGLILNVPGLFYWAPHVLIAKIFYWVTFCLSLSVLNTALAKKFN